MSKIATAFLALLGLLAAGCHRQAGQEATTPQNGQSAMLPDSGDQAGSHDPHAMTAIDVATGDLSGWDDYAGGRAVPPAPRSAAATQPAEASLSADLPEGAAPAGSDAGVATESIIPAPTAPGANNPPAP